MTIFNGKTHYKWPFSIAMLVYQRVHSPLFLVPITWMQGLPGGTNAAVRDQWIAQSVQRSVGQNANTATGDIASTSATQWTRPLSLKQRLAGLQSKNERMKVGKKGSSDCLLTKGPNKNSSKGSKCTCIRTTRKKERRWEKSWTTCTYVHCVLSLTFYSSNPFVSLKIQPANHEPELSRTFLRPPSVVCLWSPSVEALTSGASEHLTCTAAKRRLLMMSRLRNAARSAPSWTWRVIHIATGRHPRVPEKTNLNVKHHSKTVAWIDFSISFGDVFT